MTMIDALCWMLWFTISLGPNQIGHFPVTGTFGSFKECSAEGNRYWVPLLESRWPNDPHLTIYCQPCLGMKGA